MKKLKLILATFILVLMLTSCNAYKSPVYSQLNSPKSLSTTYVDLHDRIAPYFDLALDEIDIYRFNFKDDKTLELSYQSEAGGEVTKIYKGSFKKKQNYFQTGKNLVLPFLIFNYIERDLIKVGKDEQNNLLLERNLNQTTSFLFYMSNYHFDANTKIQNTYNEMSHLPLYKEHKWGYADRQQNILIEPKYDFVRTFEKDADVARVRLNGKWGYVSKNGAEMTPIEYNTIERFDSLAYARVYHMEGGIGLIARNGQTILPAIYDKIEHVGLSDSRSVCVLNKKRGIVCDNKLIYEAVFDDIKNIVKSESKFDNIRKTIPNYLCEVRINKQSYYADSNGFLYPRTGSLKDPKIDINTRTPYKEAFPKYTDIKR